MENKNTIIALVLMLLVWSGFTYFFPPQKAVVTQDIKTAAAPVATEPKQSNTAAGTINSLTEFKNTKLPDVGNIKEKTVTVENDKFIAVFSNKGASIVSFELKDYKKENSANSPLVSVVDKNKNVPSLFFTGVDGLQFDKNCVYQFEDVDHIKVINDRSINFKGITENGSPFDIIYSFTPNSYKIKVAVVYKNVTSNPQNGYIAVALNTPWTKDMAGNRLEFVGPVSFAADEVHTDKVDDLEKEPKTYKKNVAWSGFETKYFLSAIIPSSAKQVTQVVVHKEGNNVVNTVTLAPQLVNSQSTCVYEFSLFYGPKEVNILTEFGSSLEKVVDFGFFKLIAQPLHLVLKFFYKYVGNYGIAIILLTIILKMIFWPLTQKSYVSMRAMQTIQPQMKKLREKYSSDKEMLNKKMMELYKEYRVNPLGGCLPMLVQIPVFFALYKVLLDTIELRHAPFAFWITDLSIKDPYYITPVVMGITMFIQQKLSPSTMDAMQAKLMLAMPVVFTFMFLNFPAGLVIYWLVNNLLTILQQYLIFKKQPVA